MRKFWGEDSWMLPRLQTLKLVLKYNLEVSRKQNKTWISRDQVSCHLFLQKRARFFVHSGCHAKAKITINSLHRTFAEGFIVQNEVKTIMYAFIIKNKIKFFPFYFLFHDLKFPKTSCLECSKTDKMHNLFYSLIDYFFI